MMKWLVGILAILAFAPIAYALPYYQQTESLLPAQNNTYNIGTTSPSTLEYNNIFTKNITISGTCTGCGTGTPFPFTPASYGVSTTTTLGFLNGLLSTASSTIAASTTITGILTASGGIYGTLHGNADTVTNGVYTTDTGTVTNTMLAGSIPNNKLLNSSLTINGTLFNLGDSHTITAASSTLLANNNTFSGANIFTSAPTLGSLTGLIKGSSGVLSAASNGTDFTLITAKTCTLGDFVSAVTAAGVFTCTTPSSGGSAYPFSGSGNSTSTLTRFTASPLSLTASSTVFDNASSTLFTCATCWQTAVGINTSPVVNNPLQVTGTGSDNSSAILVTGGSAGINERGITVSSADNTGYAINASASGSSGRAIFGTSNSTGTGGEFSNTSTGLALKTSTGNVLFNSTSGTTGVGTSTAWGQLSASSTSAFPTLAIEQKSTGAAAIFIGGNIGIGTTTPGSILSIQSVANFVASAMSTIYNGLTILGELVGIDQTTNDKGSLSPDWHISFKLATTTPWTATSTTGSPYADTPSLGSPYTGTIKRLWCQTNAGNLTVELTDGSSHTYLVASTTGNWNLLSPALSITRGDNLVIQAGNPSSSPTSTPCTLEGYTTP